MRFFHHVAARRQYLDKVLTLRHSFGALEESCAPAYVHGNLPAAWVAWHRLFCAVQFFRKHYPGPRVLDFGAGTGELFHLLPTPLRYSYVEASDTLADYIADEVAGSTRVMADELPPSAFDAAFALDSIDQNDDPEPVLVALKRTLRPGGLLVLSGPSENGLYRLGRKITGFSGHYHETDIYHLEALAERLFARVDAVTIPFAVPLFRVSCWRPR